MNNKLYNNLINNISFSLKLSLNEGEWGYSPMAGDSACDLRDDLVEDILKLTYKKLKSYYNKYKKNTNTAYCIIGNIQFILSSLDSSYVSEDIIDLLKLYNICIEQCKNDTEWFEEWEDPEVILDEVKKAEKDIVKIVEKHSLDRKYPDIKNEE